MPYEDILFDPRDGVAWITINRPEVRNAFHGLGAEGVAHFGAVDGDPGDAVAGVVEDVVVGHGVSWLAACYAGPVACDSPS